MSKYTFCEWEENGYHDSYFYEGVWNTVTREIESIEVGSTAYAGGCGSGTAHMKLYDASEKVQEDFRNYAIFTAAEMIYNSNERDANEPQMAEFGDKLITIESTRKKDGTIIDIGVRGEVFWTGAFGTFYRNGYNKKNRSNISVGLRLLDGSKVFVALKKCKRDIVIEDFQTIKRRMEDAWDAGSFDVKPLTSCRAWLTRTYIHKTTKAA